LNSSDDNFFLTLDRVGKQLESFKHHISCTWQHSQWRKESSILIDQWQLVSVPE